MTGRIRFFFDRNIPIRLARMLDAYEGDRYDVKHLDDDGRFEPTTPDTEIITLLKEDELPVVLLTEDVKMKSRPVERAALASSKLMLVFLKKWADMEFHLRAVKLLTIWPEIVKAVERAKQPTAFEIKKKAAKVETPGRTADLAKN